MTFGAPEEMPFENILVKLLNSVFTFSHSVLYPLKDKTFWVLLEHTDMKWITPIAIYYMLELLSKPRFGYCRLHAELFECFSTL